MSNDPVPSLGANTLPEKDTEGVRSLIETWTNDLVTGQIAEWESFWAEEAVLMPPGHQRLSGLRSIADYVTQAFKPGLRFRFSDWSITGRDDLAVVTNQIELETQRTEGGSATAFNQMIVLRRAKNQGWRIQTVIFTPAID